MQQSRFSILSFLFLSVPFSYAQTCRPTTPPTSYLPCPSVTIKEAPVAPSLCPTGSASVPCPAGDHIITVRATGEKTGFGILGWAVAPLLCELKGSDACSIDYPAEGIVPGTDPLWKRIRWSKYKPSVGKGVAGLTAEIRRFSNACPNNGIILLGYSQGAQVIGDTICGRRKTGLPSLWTFLEAIDPKFLRNVKAVIQFGDPTNIPGLDWRAGSASAANNATGLFGNSVLGIARDKTRCPSILKDKWRSYCDLKDIFCDFHTKPSLGHGNDVCPHIEYMWKYEPEMLKYVIAKAKAKSLPADMVEQDPGSLEL